MMIAILSRYRLTLLVPGSGQIAHELVPIGSLLLGRVA